MPARCSIGALVGAANGFLATIVRIQPIVATLGTYLILTGVTLTILPAPIGPAPAWLKALAGPLVDPAAGGDVPGLVAGAAARPTTTS